MPDWYKVEEVAQMARIGKRAVYKEIEDGRLGCKRIGRIIRISSEHLKAWMEQADVPAQGAEGGVLATRGPQ